MGSKERGLPCFTVQVYLPSPPSLTNTLSCCQTCPLMYTYQYLDPAHFWWKLHSHDGYSSLFYCSRTLFFSHQSLSNALFWHKLLFRGKRENEENNGLSSVCLSIYNAIDGSGYILHCQRQQSRSLTIFSSLGNSATNSDNHRSR